MFSFSKNSKNSICKCNEFILLKVVINTYYNIMMYFTLQNRFVVLDIVLMYCIVNQIIIQNNTNIFVKVMYRFVHYNTIQ